MSEGTDDPDALEDARQAAAEVVSSLKRFLEAAERVVADPEAFSQITASGRSVVEAFIGGFTSGAEPSPDEPEPDDGEGDGEGDSA